jgi:sulfur relay protein TusB/DsrH
LTIYLVDEPFADTALSYAKEDPSAKVVLLQDAVYLARKKTLPGETYAVRDDVWRRGIQNAITNTIHVIGYADLIEMMETEKVANFL